MSQGLLNNRDYEYTLLGAPPARLSLRLTVLRRSKLDRFPFIDGDVADDADAVRVPTSPPTYSRD